MCKVIKTIKHKGKCVASRSLNRNMQQPVYAHRCKGLRKQRAQAVGGVCVATGTCHIVYRLSWVLLVVEPSSFEPCTFQMFLLVWDVTGTGKIFFN